MNETMSKKESASEKKAREQREMEDLRIKRKRQLLDTKNVIGILDERLQCVNSTARDCNVLLDHSKGFYEEINKLAKGRSPFLATDLVVEQINDIIRDAKEIVKGDVYLDRIKQFVPAGDNPGYSDVLVSTRAVRDGLGRGRKDLDATLAGLGKTMRKARTVVGALEYFLDDDIDSEDDKSYPSKEAIEGYMSLSVEKSCFAEYSDSGEEYFDFDALDAKSIQDYLAMTEGEAVDIPTTAKEDAESSNDPSDSDSSAESEEQDNEKEDSEA